MIKQLSLSTGPLSAIDDSVLSEYNDDKISGFSKGPPNYEKCQQLLLQLINKRPISYIILDALDECEKADRIKLIILFKTLISRSSSLLKIFISSRNEEDIRLRLEDNVPYHYITPKDNKEDIAAFVTSSLDQRILDQILLGGRASATLRLDIETKLNELADGMSVMSYYIYLYH